MQVQGLSLDTEQVQGQFGQPREACVKIKSRKEGLGCSSVVEFGMPSIHEALGLISGTEKKKKKRIIFVLDCIIPIPKQ